MTASRTTAVWLFALLLCAGCANAQDTAKFPAARRKITLRTDDAGKRFLVNVASFKTSATPAAARTAAHTVAPTTAAPTLEDVSKDAIAGLVQPAGSPASAAANQRLAQAALDSFGSYDVSASTGLSFTGLNAFEVRFIAELARNGSQGNTESPAPAMCVGNGYVLEALNFAVRIFDASQGSPVTRPISLNEFFGQRAQTDRTTGLRGPALSYPTCLFDSQSQRWLVAAARLDRNQTNAANLNTTWIDIAVSVDANPLGKWMQYNLAFRNDGVDGTPNHACVANITTGAQEPCFADRVRLGANADGVFITANEFSLRGRIHTTAIVLAFPKKDLLAGKRTVRGVEFLTPNAPTSPGLGVLTGADITPAVVPATVDPESDVQHFLSLEDLAAVNFTSSSSGVLVWTLTGTSALKGPVFSTKSLRLQATLLQMASPYSRPPFVDQLAEGPWPFGQFTNRNSTMARFGLIAVRPPNKRPQVTAWGDRMLHAVTLADGKLWGAFDTGIAGQQAIGMGWVAIEPEEPRIEKEGVLAVEKNNNVVPVMAMNSKGMGAVGFTLVGRDYFPSAAYAAFDGEGFGDIVIAGPGKGVYDSIWAHRISATDTGVNPVLGLRTAAAVDESDNVWLMAEFVDQKCTLAQYNATAPADSMCPQYPSLLVPDYSCGCTRELRDNWSTRITKVQF